jgi:uroporphyrinogen-III synthase
LSARVIITRPRREADKWVVQLTHAGFEAVTLPLIVVARAPHSQALAQVWGRLHTFDAVMFVSGNAVDYFFASKPPKSPVFTVLGAIKTRVFVTGPGSLMALQRAHVPPQCIDAPDMGAGLFDSEALWAVVRDQIRAGYRLLVVRGVGGAWTSGDTGQGRDWFAAQAQGAGASVEFVVAYQRLCPELSPGQLVLAQTAAKDGSVWLFSSSEAIVNLVHSCPEQTWAQAKAVVTHPRIGLVARQAGFGVVCESRPTLNTLIASIESMQ